MITHRLSAVLSAAKDIIADPRNWHIGYFARNTWGRHVPSSSEEACAWCSFGAVELAVHKLGGGPEHCAAPKAMLNEVAISLGHPSMPIMNDSESHNAIMTAFDLAIYHATVREIQNACV